MNRIERIVELDNNNKSSNGKNLKSLKTSLIDYDKIALLGDPGIGKTNELYATAKELWETKKETGIIPIFIDLKDYIYSKPFESLIKYSDWKKFSQLVFFIDGLDEVERIIEFKKQLERFIEENPKHKYVISCRTNIYDKYLINLTGFKIASLPELTYSQALKVLNNELSKEQVAEIPNNDIIDKPFFKTPFFLKLYIHFIKDQNKIPTNEADLWNKYVEKSLTRHKKKIESKYELNIEKLKADSKKMCLALELSMKNTFNGDEIYSIIRDSNLNFQESPFIYRREDNSFAFNHKQIQEYFAALSLLDLGFQSFLSLLKIPEADKIKPSLMNTLGFLLNLVEKESSNYKELVDWLLTYEPELLFDIEVDRLEKDLRLQVFKRYYSKEFVEKELFTHYEELRKLGRFANFPETFDYLFEILRDEKQYNENVRKNALNLLAYIDIPPSQEEAVKDSLIYLIKCNIDRLNEWSHIFTYIGKTKLKEDRDFVNEILEIYYNNISEDFGHYLSEVIFNVDDKDCYIKFLESEFSYYLGGKERRRETSVYYSNMGLDLMATMLNSENTLRILPYFLSYNSNNYLRTSAEQFFKRLEEYINTKEDYLHKVLDVYIETKAYEHEFLNDGILYLTIQHSGKVMESIDYLHKKYDLSQFSDLIAKWITRETVERIIEVVFDNQYKKEDQLRFYYHIGFKDDGYVIFKMIEDKAVEIEPKIERRKNPAQLQEIELKLKEFKQSEFNKLFNASLISEEVESFFSDNNIENLSSEIFYKIEREESEKGNHDQYEWQIRSSKAFRQVITNILRYYRQHSFAKNEVLYIVESEKILYFVIKDIWEKNQWIVFSDSQKEWIQSKTAELTDINSPKYEKLDIQNGTYTYCLLSIVYFYRKDIVELDSQYKYDLLKISIPNEVDSDISLFDFIEIEDSVEFRKQVIVNMLEDKVKDKLALESHINYCITNKISETFPNIEDHILKLNIYRYNDTVRAYYNIEKNDEFLIKCIEVDDLKYVALNILVENRDNFPKVYEECVKLKNSKSSYDFELAVKLLFQMNHKDAFKSLIDFSNNYNNGKAPSFTQYNNAIGDYNNMDAISDFIEILVLADPDKREPFSVFRTLHNVYINNTCTEKNNLDRICSILDSIINERKAKGLSVFYFSQLIEHANNVYLNELNKPMTFSDAKKLVEELL
ncbi:MAG: hypothetical protein JNL75_04195 [Chitinophagales bacterium]|nr:hypothetical protein [Chitinophagales bacterium]